MSNPRIGAIAVVTLIAFVNPQSAQAQSSSDYTAWLEWCRTVGRPSGTPSNPVCIPNPQGGGSSGGSSGYSPPAYSGPSVDELARQARERQRLEDKRRAEQARKEAEAAESQRRFIAERDAAAQSLKGGTGTPFFGAGALKGGAPAGATIRDIKPAADVRDLGGAQAAWKQLNCAASLSGSAFAALTRRTGPDYDEFSYMTGQATNALNGDPLGVQCPAAPAMPKFNAAKSSIKYLLLLERMKKDAADLKQAQSARKANLDKLIKAKRKLLELGGANAKATVELASLEKQRQSLGPLTVRPAAAPPPLTPAMVTEEEAKKSAMAEALAAARTAKAAYEAATRSESAKEANLKRMSDIAGKIEKGDPTGASLLDQMFPK